MLSKKNETFFWSGIEKFSTYGIQFIVTIIIARILSPEDYGLVAMLNIFFALSQALIDGGFSTALIQKQNCSQNEYSTIFYFNIIVSLLLYALLFFCSDFIAELFDNHLLIILTKVYSLNLIINSITMVHRTLITKRLMFKELAIISFVSSVIGGIIGIIMAYFGFKYWALVFQILTLSVISGLMSIFFIKWKPSLIFSIKAFKDLAPFGFKMMLTSIISALYNNMYSLVIGSKYKAEELGLFNRAYTFSSIIPIGVSDFSMRALFPLQVKLQDDDFNLINDFLRSLHMIMFLLIPINLFFVFNANDIIIFVLSNKWIKMVYLFQLLSISLIFYPMVQLNWNIMKVKGRSDLLFKSELIKKVIGLIILLITVNFGITIMTLGLLFYSIIDIYISVYFVNKIIDLPFMKQIKCINSIFSMALISSLVSYLISSLIPIISFRLFFSFLLFACLYTLLSILVKDSAIDYVKNMFK